MLAGVAAVAVAFIAEEARALDAGAAAGLYISGTSLGGLVGRLVAAPVAELSGSWRWGMLAVSAVAAVAAVLFMFLLPPARRFSPVPRAGAVRQTLYRLGRNLRSPVLLALYALAFLLMGSFVTVFNYVGFMLEGPSFGLSQTAVSLIFLTYLTGTVASSRAVVLVGRWGYVRVLVLSLLALVVGIGFTFADSLVLVVVGLAFITVGFFSGHSVAAALTGVWASAGKAQATALYNVSYYVGGAVVGWLGGFFFAAGGWFLTGLFCAVVVLVVGSGAVLVLRRCVGSV